MSLTNQFAELTQHILQLEQQYHRPPHSVILLGVSKKQPIIKLEQMAELGLLHFGENQVQEAIPKIQHLQHKSLIWHFIGRIQSNKTKLITQYFDWVHSLDRVDIAKKLSAHRTTGHSLNVLIQVNVDNEPQKSGVSLSELNTFASTIRFLPNLKLRGLMCIPKPSFNFSSQQKPFHALKIAFEQLNQQGYALDTLSMGMSTDYEAAIAEGSTCVRLGTALFGSRS